MKLKTNLKAGAKLKVKSQKDACGVYQKWFTLKPTYGDIKSQAAEWGCKWAQK